MTINFHTDPATFASKVRGLSPLTMYCASRSNTRGAGQWLTIDGVTFTDATTWGTPTLAPYLGSRAASANCESAGYADFVSAVP